MGSAPPGNERCRTAISVVSNRNVELGYGLSRLVIFLVSKWTITYLEGS